MKCPNCAAELEKEFYEKVIDFRCPGCGGRMMTVSGLRTLCADRDFTNMLWNTARNGYSQGGPVCTSCGEPMRRVTLPLSGMALELDVCCSCRLVWFDPGELARIPLPRPEAREELPQEAKEVLAMRQIEVEGTRLRRVLRESDSDENAPDEGWKYFAALLGMPVELDAPECNRKPIVTWFIAAVCVVVFGLTFLNLPAAIDKWGFIPAEWTRYGGLTVFTSMFLHGGFFHLIGNLYFLLVFGDNVEDEFGWFKYIALLVASGLSAVLLHGIFDPRSTVPCVGASGFISGVIACYAICFPKVRLSFMLWARSFTFAFFSGRNWLAIPAWGAFGIWIFFQVVMAAVSKSGGGGVAYMAHIGGVLPGILFAIYYRCRRRAEYQDASKSLDDLKNVKEL